ncbi:Protein-L-isoaspartate O-methyltransferase [bacterium HR39]|nr:Protein-L-isoaspartate O-methyltransferase [bacterium HR39]
MDFDRARRNMVENQLRPNRIEDPRVLAAMGSVPREVFVPASLKGVAYSDEDLDLGDGRRLIEPLALARMLQAAETRPGDTALVIGCETGYVAAVLGKLVTTVFMLTERPGEGEAVERLLAGLGCENVVIQPGDPRVGLPELAPFDVILLAGSVVEAPHHLLEQLAEGGRLVAVTSHGQCGHVTVWRRSGDSFGATRPYDAWIPPLEALLPQPGFVF